MKSLLKKLPGIEQIVSSDMWRNYRHGVTLRTVTRKNSHFTHFMRLPAQFETLAGPVVDFILHEDPTRSVKIYSIGCSIGAEAYTAASYLAARRPGLDFRLLGFDTHAKVVERARAGVYDAKTEVFNNKRITQEFIDQTFDVDGEAYKVKNHIREHVEFHVADILDVDAVDVFGTADVVMAQNFLFHLEPADAATAFDNICRLLADRGVLFIDGTDIPIRTRMSRKHNLEPMDYKIEEIHDQARWVRAAGWPYRYWGLEELSKSRRDWKRRYATIFVKEES